MTKQRSIGLHNTGAEYKLMPFDQKIHSHKNNLNGTQYVLILESMTVSQIIPLTPPRLAFFLIPCMVFVISVLYKGTLSLESFSCVHILYLHEMYRVNSAQNILSYLSEHNCYPVDVSRPPRVATSKDSFLPNMHEVF